MLYTFFAKTVICYVLNVFDTSAKKILKLIEKKNQIISFLEEKGIAGRYFSRH